MPDDLTQDLLSVRDWLRYATSRLRESGVVFGHGTSDAVDEAAFILLEMLHLPIDDINPWLDCRLLPSERERLRDVLHARIVDRKPAAYLTNSAYIQGRRFYVDERVIVPRSYIGELLVTGGLAGLTLDPFDVETVLDMCTGSGCLAILAAEAFPDASVTAVDISADALAVAARNVADYELETRIRLTQSDLFEALAGQRFDVIIANPPYVSADRVAGFPAEYRAEPTLAHAGGAEGLDLVRRILNAAPGHLTGEGTLIVEIGETRPALEQAEPELPFVWLETETSTGEVFALQAGDLAIWKEKKRR